MKLINKKNLVGIVSIAATVAGMGLALVNSWVSDKQMDDKIEEKVAEEFARREEESE